jgi:putative transposase
MFEVPLAQLVLPVEPEPSHNKYDTPTKSIPFKYAAADELASLFESFRLMCNEAIAIALRAKPTNKFGLITLAYPQLRRFGLHSHYILSACEVAHSVYRNERRRSTAYVRKAFLKLDNQSYWLDHLLLRIPTTPRHFTFLKLHGSDYHLSYVHDPNLRRGSIAITQRSVSIAFSKKVLVLEPLGFIGMDVNEKNVTISSTDGCSRRFTKIEEVVEIKERYREMRARVGRMTRHDNRICKDLLAKYGERERNRTNQRIHSVTRKIVDYARENQFGVKMERLTGIRKLYLKGNGQGRYFRGRMNSWVFGEIQRQTDYKARWKGVPVYFVNPRGTSRNCPECGSRVVPLADRKLYCQKCDKTWDRDVLASMNLLACAVPQDRPPKGSCEGERDDGCSNPPSRWAEENPAASASRRVSQNLKGSFRGSEESPSRRF